MICAGLLSPLLTYLVLRTCQIALSTVNSEGIASGLQAYHGHHPRSYGADKGKVHATHLIHVIGKNVLLYYRFILGVIALVLMVGRWEQHPACKKQKAS